MRDIPWFIELTKYNRYLKGDPLTIAISEIESYTTVGSSGITQVVTKSGNTYEVEESAVKIREMLVGMKLP